MLVQSTDLIQILPALHACAHVCVCVCVCVCVYILMCVASFSGYKIIYRLYLAC